MDLSDILEIMASTDEYVSLYDFLPSSYPYSDDGFEPLSDEITQIDIFLIYSAFRRCMHHFPSLSDDSASRDEYFFRVFKDLKNWTKGFFENGRHLFSNERKYLVNDYILEDTELAKFNRYAESFHNLSNVIDAHIHATERHDPNYVWSSLFEKTDCFDHCRGVKHYSFKNYMQWMPPFMKEAILTVPESERVKWCVYLLLTYHYEDECGLFVSCALKFCLRAFDLCEQAYRVYGFETFAKMMRYIYLIKEFECDTQVLLNCLRVHCISHHIEDRLFKKPLLLKYILGKIQAGNAELPIELRSISRYIDPSMIFRKNADDFFVEELDTFLVLIEFGASSDFVENTYAEIIRKIPYSVVKGKCFRKLNLKKSNTCKYRCVQLVYLYSCTPDLCTCERDEALQALWASIPEPLLTKMDIWICFQVERMTKISKNVRRAWRWYDKIVAKGESLYRSPRCLQHLARCAIRHRLKKHFRLPTGVDTLMLPEKLKDYLLLKT